MSDKETKPEPFCKNCGGIKSAHIVGAFGLRCLPNCDSWFVERIDHPTPPPPSETPEMPGTLSKAQLYRLCCNLMLDLGLAAEYDPRMKGLRSVELRDLKPSEGHWPKPRPLTDKEIRAMVGKYFRNGGKHD